MATTAQIKIDGDASGALRSIAQIERALGNIQSTATSASRGVSQLTGALTAAAGAVVGASLFNFVDQLQNMQNKLRIATTSTDDFNQSLEYVKAIADKTGQSLAATGDLYAAVSRNSNKLGYDQGQVATATNAMATALQASGTSAEGARSVMYQFSQILAKGKVNGDEFTTIMENLGGPVMDTVAKNMGLTTAELIKYKEKGLIGAKDFTDALIKSLDELDQMNGKTMPTLGQNLQRIQNSFAVFVIKLDKATGFTQALGNAMNWLSKNVDTVLPILAAMVGYMVAGRILAFATALFEVVKAIRAVGIAAAVTEALATGGISAIAGLAGAAAAYAGASAMFDKVDGSIQNMNVDLKATGSTAVSSLGATNGQLSGIGDKLKDILKDLDHQLTLGVSNSREFGIQSKILDYNKSLEYAMTTEQKAQVASRLQALELMKAQRDIIDQIQQLQSDILVLDAETTIQRNQQLALEKYRLQTGQELTGNLKEELLENIKIKTVKEETSKIHNELLSASYTEVQIRGVLKDLTSQELDAFSQSLSLQKSLGAELSVQTQMEMQMTDLVKKRLEYYKQMKAGVEKVNVPLSGAAAGAAAAGQLGQLDPVTQAITNQQTINAGLEELRNQGLISEQQYQVARVNAAVMANSQIQESTRQMFENQKMFELQSQQGSIFGYEQQKQIAKDAADFQMKSDYEKAQFGIQQAASVFDSLGKYNKEAFMAAKAFNIANAVMNTYMGATKALATYPPPFNFIAAAAVVASGLAQVASIRSQQYSGRALGGPVMGNQSYIVGENGPELFTPNTTGSITRNSDLQGGQPVNVNFNIVANDTTGFDELLTSRQGVIKQIISDAMLERGQRSIV